MNGDQVRIYDSVRNLLAGDTSNLDYIDGSELGTLKDLMGNAAPYRGNAIKEAKTAKDALTQKVNDQIKEEQLLAIQTIEEAIKKLQGKD